LVSTFELVGILAVRVVSRPSACNVFLRTLAGDRPRLLRPPLR
jgi:hypothetical protein